MNLNLIKETICAIFVLAAITFFGSIVFEKQINPELKKIVKINIDINK